MRLIPFCAFPRFNLSSWVYLFAEMVLSNEHFEADKTIASKCKTKTSHRCRWWKRDKHSSGPVHIPARSKSCHLMAHFISTYLHTQSRAQRSLLPIEKWDHQDAKRSFLLPLTKQRTHKKAHQNQTQIAQERTGFGKMLLNEPNRNIAPKSGMRQ